VDQSYTVADTRRDALDTDPIPPLRPSIHAPDDVHQGRLSRPRGAHHGHELAGPHLERDAAKRVDLDVPHPIDLGDVLEREKRLCGSSGVHQNTRPPPRMALAAPPERLAPSPPVASVTSVSRSCSS